MGRLDIVKLLLACPGVDVTLKTLKDQKTILMGACFSGNVELVKLLLSNPLIKKSINAVDATGYSVLNLVLRTDWIKNKAQIMVLLGDNGAENKAPSGIEAYLAMLEGAL